MRIKIKKDQAFVLVLLWSILGYPFVVATTTLFPNFDNQQVSVFFRAIVFATSSIGILAYLINRKLGRLSFPLFLFLLFWGAYFAKLAISLHVNGEPASREPWVFWIWSIGTCFIPALFIYLATNLRAVARMSTPAMAAGCASIIILLVFGGTSYVTSGGSAIDLKRWNVEALNPISMGHLGATTALIGIATMFGPVPRLLVRALSFASLVLGTMLLIYANSRGPIVALGFAVSFLVFANARNRIGLAAASSLLAGSAYLSIARADFLFSQYGIVSRFLTIAGQQDAAVSSRLRSYTGALNQFYSSPVFGDGIEERFTQFYPHNVVLEAFMATGLSGGIPFLMLAIITVYSSWRLVRDSKKAAWLGLLAIQYLIGAQFSGAIYQSWTMWALVMASVSVARLVSASDKNRGAIVRRRAGVGPNGRNPELMLGSAR